MSMKQTIVALAAGIAGAMGAQAQCLSDGDVGVLASHYSARTPAPNFPALSDADGACTRAKLNVLLASSLGKVVGYKAGLTNPAVQKRFNTDKPVWGKLYEGMVQPSGAAVPAAFGARPLYEADMLVRVRDAAINHARTPYEVLQHIDQVIPFIELPDLVVQAPPQLNGPGVAAINVGARLGVAGQPIAVPATRGERYALLDALERMDVQLTNQQGQLLASGKGRDILGQPLNAVVWIAQALQQEGITLQPGDLISLGSFSPLLPPRAGLSVTATYAGLPGAQPVQVHFK
ncbi:2-keto-4-pentenoate hydratase [Alicycliphilus sp. T452]